MRPEVIFLDWDGTVSGSRFWGHWANDDTWREANALIQSRFFQLSPEILTAWMRGDWDAEKIVAEISRRTGIAAQNLLAGLQESCENMQPFDADIFDVIATIRKNGTKVVVATDNMDTFLRWTAPALQLHNHFDDILSSHPLRALKKDTDTLGKSKFFTQYLTQNRINPSATVLVDDSIHNTAVQDFGLGYIQVTPHASAIQILRQLDELPKTPYT